MKTVQAPYDLPPTAKVNVGYRQPLSGSYRSNHINKQQQQQQQPQCLVSYATVAAVATVVATATVATSNSFFKVV